MTVPKMIKGREKEPHTHTYDDDIIYTKDMFSTNLKRKITNAEFKTKMTRPTEVN